MVAAGKQSTNGSRPKTIKLDKIRLDGDTQSRVELDEDVVKEYADLMKDGVEFPPLGVTFDGTDYWLYDGFHRRHAAIKANLKEFRVIAINGTREDARWFSYSANITHGIRRTIEDKKKAVISALKHPKGAKLSDNKIAEHVGVSHSTVAKYRGQLESSCQIGKMDSREVTRGDTTYEQSTANIGKSKPKAIDDNGDERTADGIILKPAPVVDFGDRSRGKVDQKPIEPLPEPYEEPNGFLADVAKGEAAEEALIAEMKAHNLELDRYARRIQAAFDDERPASAWLDETQLGIVGDSIKAALASIRVMKCDNLCPKCDGSKRLGSKKCHWCRETGYMPKRNYEMAGGK